MQYPKYFIQLECGDNFIKSAIFDDTVVVATEFGGGSGTAYDPFLISTPAHLKKLIEDVNRPKDNISYKGVNFLLNIDLHVSTANWIPLGIYSSSVFEGIFDGGGHTISGKLEGNIPYFGFFGHIRNGEVRNLNVSADVICNYGKSDYHARIGGIVGQIADGRIVNCHKTSGITTISSTTTNVATTYLGGIIGYFADGEVFSCSNSGKVFCPSGVGSNNYCGGIVGFGSAGDRLNENIYIEDCVNWGNVVSNGTTTSNCGGIAGYVITLGFRDKGSLLKCINYGDITVTNAYEAKSGGLLGHGSVDCVSDCLNAGTIFASSHNSRSCSGGLIGWFLGANLHNNRNTGVVVGDGNAGSGALVGFRYEYEEGRYYSGKIYDCNINESKSPANWVGNMDDNFKGDVGGEECKHSN